MKKCFTICVDLDDTIENLLAAWIIWLDQKYNLNVQLEDINDWEMRNNFPTLTQEQIFEPLYLREFWQTVTPKQDAQKYLKKLYDEQQQIYICTCSHYKTVLIKYEEIIAKYFPFIDWRHLIIMHDKQMINCDIFVDDAPHNLIDGKYHKILMSAQHNKSFDTDAAGIYRADNWEQIYNYVHVLDAVYTEEGRYTK